MDLTGLPYIVMASINKDADPMQHKFQTEEEAQEFGKMAQDMGFIAEFYLISGCRQKHLYDYYPEGYKHPDTSPCIEINEYKKFDIEEED